MDYIIDIDYNEILFGIFCFNLNEIIIIQLNNLKSKLWLVLYNVILISLAYLFFRHQKKVRKIK
jgi:hypothetical protein